MKHKFFKIVSKHSSLAVWSGITCKAWGLWKFSVITYIGSTDSAGQALNRMNILISSVYSCSIHTLKSGEKLSTEVEMESEDTAEADLVCTEFSEWEVEALQNIKTQDVWKMGLCRPILDVWFITPIFTTTCIVSIYNSNIYCNLHCKQVLGCLFHGS